MLLENLDSTESTIATLEKELGIKLSEMSELELGIKLPELGMKLSKEEVRYQALNLAQTHPNSRPSPSPSPSPSPNPKLNPNYSKHISQAPVVPDVDVRNNEGNDRNDQYESGILACHDDDDLASDDDDEATYEEDFEFEGKAFSMCIQWY